MQRSKIVINCLPRITPILEKEVKSLGYSLDEVGKTHVSTKGDWEDIINLNLKLRTANRVLWHIQDFRAKNAAELHEKAYTIPWHQLIPRNSIVKIHSFVKNDSIKDTRFPNVKLKDAIVDRYKKETGRRPNSGNTNEGTVVYLHWVDDNCSIYFDTSGETIAKHGYRTNMVKAPMMENLAAACILASKWDFNTHFINPMCGSGTLAIEALHIAKNIFPTHFRKAYSFQHLKGYDEFLFSQIRTRILREADLLSKPDFEVVVSDMDKSAVEVAARNAKNAKVAQFLKYEIKKFEETHVPEGEGVVFINPPYGERLGATSELGDLYRMMGDFLKQRCTGKTGYIFSGNLNLAKQIGLKAKRRIEFNNGKIDSRLLEYELFRGSGR